MVYVRLKDIAEKAGVSINTVSRSLKDKPDISEKTRQRIRQIADELGYIPHANASGLRSRKSNTIGIIVTHINNAFFSRILQGISDAISSYGYTIITLTSNEDISREKDLFITLASNRVEGIIFVPSRDIENTINYDEINVPHLTIVRKGNLNTQDYFTIDSYQSGRIAADYFLQLGRKQPAYIGYALPVSCNKARLDGFRERLYEHKIELKKSSVELCNSTSDSAYQATRKLVEREGHVDSIFVYNDQMAFGVVRALYDGGIKIPEEISVVGHDDIEEAKHFIPALSTIRVSKYRLGYESAECLIEKIQNKNSSSKSVIYNPEMIVRET
ncbi:MAG: LacI family DNA-binding transcriptional regulator [Spirochaetaceae bacterium]